MCVFVVRYKRNQLPLHDGGPQGLGHCRADRGLRLPQLRTQTHGPRLLLWPAVSWSEKNPPSLHDSWFYDRCYVFFPPDWDAFIFGYESNLLWPYLGKKTPVTIRIPGFWPTIFWGESQLDEMTTLASDLQKEGYCSWSWFSTCSFFDLFLWVISWQYIYIYIYCIHVYIIYIYILCICI